MKKILFLMSAVLLTFTLPQRLSAAGEGAWVGNVNALLGTKALDKEDWRPVEEQGEFGVEADFKKRAWPVGIAADFLYGLKKGRLYDPFLGTVDIESETSELNVGLRKVWDGFPHVRPFIGGGLSLAKATAKVTLFGLPVENSGSGAGYWLGGGAKVKEADRPPAAVSGDRVENPSDSLDRERLELEKQKLEIEKQKLDLEKQKFEIEKSKLQTP